MAASTSHTPAHESVNTVAPFRAWRGFRPIIARGPAQAAISHLIAESGEMYLYLEVMSNSTKQLFQINRRINPNLICTFLQKDLSPCPTMLFKLMQKYSHIIHLRRDT